MRVSVLIPAFNEAATLCECVRAVRDTNPDLDLEVILVDDGSTDATESVARGMNGSIAKYVRHPRNRGKGGAIRTGLAVATGDVVIIQDADLEYDPADYRRLLAPIEAGEAQVVYGSRTLDRENRRSYRRYYWGGRVLSWWTNLLFGSRITDEPTCYKVFRADLLRSLDLQCTGFEFCPEVTAKVLRRRVAIVEVPISYRPRSLEEGKKIRWHDGVKAAWTLLKYRFAR